LASPEALLRRLLLIEAAALDLAARPPRARAPRQRVRRRFEFWPDKPEDWRVSFRCFQASQARETKTGRGPSRACAVSSAARDVGRFRDAWPLAERYEALIRAFNTPHPHARRLARRLRAEPKALAAVLAAAPEYADRVDNAEELTERAHSAWARRPDSS
jgi:hypothetical protein